MSMSVSWDSCHIAMIEIPVLFPRPCFLKKSVSEHGDGVHQTEEACILEHAVDEAHVDQVVRVGNDRIEECFDQLETHRSGPGKLPGPGQIFQLDLFV